LPQFVKPQQLQRFWRGDQKVNAVLNVVVFSNLKYNGKEIVEMAKVKSLSTESEISHKFSGFMVHPDQQEGMMINDSIEPWNRWKHSSCKSTECHP